MPDTFVKIASVTVGSGGASSIDFTSIPATYTDLNLLMSLRNASTFGTVRISYNSNTSNYTAKRLFLNLNTVGSDSATRDILIENDAAFTASTFASNSLYIPNYAGNSNKSASADWVTENNATNNYLGLVASLWSDTAAITSITLTPVAGTFAQHSTAVLYGIKNS